MSLKTLRPRTSQPSMPTQICGLLCVWATVVGLQCVRPTKSGIAASLGVGQ